MITVGGFNTSMDELIELDTLALGEVHRAKSVTAYPGGKGLHVATTVAALGEPVALVGLIDRAYRGTFERWLSARGVVFHGIEVDGAIRNCFAIRERSGRITEILEPGPNVDPELAEEMLLQVRELAAASKVAVLSGSLPRGLDVQTYARLVASLRGPTEDRDGADLGPWHDTGSGVRCLVDASDDLLRHTLPARPFMVKPNREEAEKWLGAPIENLAAAARAAERMAEGGTAVVVVSLGDEGALAYSRGECLHASVPIPECRNPVGSGDALVGGMAVGLARDLSFDATLRLGVACGAANALTAETGLFRREDVERLFPLVTVRRFTLTGSGD
ncbi:1-phosphofructokinase family hexose kinase [Pendulispora albinea]|uniref:1-phosphofructokinase family hexose kinase n=1 Tax=Pendulispora albinea TaxID=2741071 RepID=A0ABZ2LJE0_9BACT